MIYIDSFQFLSFLLDTLVENLGKIACKYSTQELDNNILDLGQQNDFTLISIWVILESFKKICQARKSFIVPWPVKEYWKGVWPYF